MEERGCVSAVPPVCERATAVALNLSAPGLYRDYNQSTNHSNLLFPRDSSGTCAGASASARACVRQCVFTLARRAITGGRVNLTDPILPHSLHSDCVRTTPNGFYYV